MFKSKLFWFLVSFPFVTLALFLFLASFFVDDRGRIQASHQPGAVQHDLG